MGGRKFLARKLTQRGNFGDRELEVLMVSDSTNLFKLQVLLPILQIISLTWEIGCEAEGFRVLWVVGAEIDTEEFMV